MGIKGKNDRMVVLACEDCKERNYTTTKNKKTIDKGRVIYYNVTKGELYIINVIYNCGRIAAERRSPTGEFLCRNFTRKNDMDSFPNYKSAPNANQYHQPSN